MTTLNGLVRIDSSLAYLNIRVAGRFDPLVLTTHRGRAGPRDDTPFRRWAQFCGQRPRLGQRVQLEARLVARQGGQREAQKPTGLDLLA